MKVIPDIMATEPHEWYHNISLINVFGYLVFCYVTHSACSGQNETVSISQMVFLNDIFLNENFH